jgi:hypothetical protein
VEVAVLAVAAAKAGDSIVVVAPEVRAVARVLEAAVSLVLESVAVEVAALRVQTVD